jgi:hypothetical protein
MKDWLYYRIYAKPSQGWYSNLLREVVRPFIQKNEKLIDSFFFFEYHHNYGVPPYDSEIEAKEPKFKKGDEVWFIRLRVLAEQENLKALDDNLIKYMDNSQTILDKEKCSFDEKADLGGRFGETRIELVRKYLEYASRITLSLLDERKDKAYFDKISGLIHLPSNMLEYAIICQKCGKIIQL